MQLKDIMTHNVEAVSEDTLILEAARKMATHQVGFLPVFDSKEAIGVITDRDIVVRGIAEGFDPKTTPVSQVMTTGVEMLNEDDDAEKAVKRMQKEGIRRVLVRGTHDRYVGVVSLDDLACRLGAEATGELLRKVSHSASAS